MPRFEGVGALVTGSTSGIGRAIAGALAEEGARVIRHGLPGEPAPGEVLHEDLAAPGAGRRLGERAGALTAIDVLVVAASLQVREPWQSITADQAARQFNVNLLSTLELVQTLVPPMAARGWGRVLVLGSVQQRRPHPEMAVYAALKSAQANLVANLARQLAPSGVTVNCLSPGIVETPRNTEALAVPAYRRQVVDEIPVGRIGVPDDCVPAALLLCARESEFITGQDLVVDGGYTL